tara:strand:+ start:67 stop:222 length:156 start_codon:yes stop_codon:yes gene_type:complete
MNTKKRVKNIDEDKIYYYIDKEHCLIVNEDKVYYIDNEICLDIEDVLTKKH